jgi:putrescine aminotransferase
MGRMSTFPNYSDCAHDLANEWADRLVDATRRERIYGVFFSGGGSESVETAIKLSRQYWELVGAPSKTKLLSRRCYIHISQPARSPA